MLRVHNSNRNRSYYNSSLYALCFCLHWISLNFIFEFVNKQFEMLRGTFDCWLLVWRLVRLITPNTIGPNRNETVNETLTRDRMRVYGQYVLASAQINFIFDRLLQLLSESAAIESGNDVGDGADNYLEASIGIESLLDNSFSEADDLMAFTDRAKLEQTELWEPNQEYSMLFWGAGPIHQSIITFSLSSSRLQWHFVQRRWRTNFLGVRTFAGHPEKGGGKICIQNTYPGLELQQHQVSMRIDTKLSKIAKLIRKRFSLSRCSDPEIWHSCAISRCCIRWYWTATLRWMRRRCRLCRVCGFCGSTNAASRIYRNGSNDWKCARRIYGNYHWWEIRVHCHSSMAARYLKITIICKF